MQDCECGKCANKLCWVGGPLAYAICGWIKKTHVCCDAHTCSLKYTTTTTLKPGCFPAAAAVSLANGESVTMSELKVGDRVQIGAHFEKI